MHADRLHRHVKQLCERNLKSDHVKCCAQCPWEDEIVEAYPHLKGFFRRKRKSRGGSDA